jgi:transcriptional regulator with XRE-family HTH domain
MPARSRPADVGANALRQQMQRLGTEARTARPALGWTQAAAARRARFSQASVSRLEAGDTTLSISIIARTFGALGMKLVLSSYPADGVSLRDSGQLVLAKAIGAMAHPSWRTLLEAPTGEGRQAADVLLLGRTAGIHIELESALVDFQAQLRRCELKRTALQARHEMRIAFVLAVRDTARNRAGVQPHLLVIRQALPAGSREVMCAIRGGASLQRDGLLWIRPPHRRAIPT